jgi:hypothetical protein
MVLELQASVEAEPGSEHRVDQRSNVFVVAALYSGDASTPVRIRNMSRSGALVEGAAFPAPGTEVRLSRGSLAIQGRVMWVEDRRAGLRFVGTISVPDWLPNAQKNPRQMHIDEIVHQAKLGVAPSPTGFAVQRRDPAAMAADMLQLKDSIDRLAEDLAGDPHVTASHPSSLQILDVAAQALAKLSAELKGA